MQFCNYYHEEVIVRLSLYYVTSSVSVYFFFENKDDF